MLAAFSRYYNGRIYVMLRDKSALHKFQVFTDEGKTLFFEQQDDMYKYLKRDRDDDKRIV